MRVAVAVCVLGVLGAAVPADAARTGTVYVTGRVLDGTGRGVPGATVSFELHPDPALYNQQYCPVRPWEIQCRVHKVARRTDAGGRYRLPVNLASFLATERRHRLVITDAPRPGVLLPAQTETTMYLGGRSQQVADLPVWRPKVSLEPAGAGKRMLHVDPFSAAYGHAYTSGPVTELLQGSTPVWSFPKVVEDREVDARVVETGTTAIRATDSRVLGRHFPVFRSPAYAVRSPVRPVSRGVACATYGRGDALLPLAGCKFTDGRLGTPIALSYQRAGNKACDVASQCANPRRVLVDLGSPQVVSAYAVRGCATVPPAELSAEGVAFVPYQTHDFGDGLRVGAPLPVRYVRVDLSKCAFKVTEVSVFAP
ncbi:MAG TPA: hypothetical protein VNA20_03270 [Frankiaceae bacterium]|nr:hypothetical protein [Frankiaceae bacterium]